MQKQPDDLIISGSPEYLLKPLADKLGVQLIGTITDTETGVMIGNVRLAKEKAKYIIEQDMPMIDNFYSDSLSDTPVALLAERAFIVKEKAQVPEPWSHLNPKVLKKVHKKLIFKSSFFYIKTAPISRSSFLSAEQYILR